jgi:hypothetical protein
VTDELGAVVGRLGRAALNGDDDVSVEEAMTLGPSTVRPALELEQALECMRNQNPTSLPVTAPTACSSARFESTTSSTPPDRRRNEAGPIERSALKPEAAGRSMVFGRRPRARVRRRPACSLPVLRMVACPRVR